MQEKKLWSNFILDVILSRDRTREGINRWFSNQPSGYAEASNKTSWKSDLRPSLFEDYVNHSPGLQGTRANQVPRTSHPSGSRLVFFDRGIGNINSNISYLVKKIHLSPKDFLLMFERVSKQGISKRN